MIKAALAIFICLYATHPVVPTISAQLSPPQTITTRPVDPSVRFQAMDLIIDSGDHPLACYQLQFKAVQGNVKIVGIENGESVFADQPPYYDPKAIVNDHVKIAAFSLKANNQLPRGKTRVARLHLMITGSIEPTFTATLQVAVNGDAKAIPAQLILRKD